MKNATKVKLFSCPCVQQSITPWRYILCLIKHHWTEGCWAPQPVWTWWWMGNNPCTCQESNPSHPAHSLVTIRLSYSGKWLCIPNLIPRYIGALTSTVSKNRT